ncbi:hypothetical protein CUC44_18475 [Aeromonas lusitana]|uniref:Uncharacterized protein n=1 Tax=Aeromonas lusitana TaxID=931529 RepID=A0A2M8H5P0_9GAMM|nr:hypothetical protein CUC44_18475 [Aeromonas lusitana]
MSALAGAVYDNGRGGAEKEVPKMMQTGCVAANWRQGGGLSRLLTAKDVPECAALATGLLPAKAASGLAGSSYHCFDFKAWIFACCYS